MFIFAKVIFMPIQFRNEKIRFELKKKSVLQKWIFAVSGKEKKQIGELHFVFCNDEFLLKLNKKYLNHTSLTDIITFDYSSDKKLISEIYISIPRVKENAKNFQTLFENELHRVMIHGMLHLYGYKDKTKSQKEKIRKKENDCLKLLNKII